MYTPTEVCDKPGGLEPDGKGFKFHKLYMSIQSFHLPQTYGYANNRNKNLSCLRLKTSNNYGEGDLQAPLTP
ncbi:hypothetical protein RSOLAG1IB_00406 [Rhizoctonia solani AG-1 IB]|uniref:Uncharacterized protein n=1 Tax=Thanatephorus cucumeris (strain AG1-IB / isolate 7/3/14) TaxID=1108050 RepID=A0A0B7F4I5_THACB|nr:hypothetical protein RSOLAG1IB_00406 [Rhizoctonia solani AG-1 IB]